MKISLGMELKFTLETIQLAAKKFLTAIDDRKIIALHGEMGAGKTTFINAICRELQVHGNVSSPTYSIINEYLIPSGKIYHMDLYRLKDEKEAVEAGVEECILSGKLCLIEWPGRTPGILPEETLHCHFYPVTDNERKLRINL